MGRCPATGDEPGRRLRSGSILRMMTTGYADGLAEGGRAGQEAPGDLRPSCTEPGKQREEQVRWWALPSSYVERRVWLLELCLRGRDMYVRVTSCPVLEPWEWRRWD